MKIDEQKVNDLGGSAGYVTLMGIMRYVSGCILRERERLARAIPEHADAIRDTSMDDLVFKWSGPETPLDTPPKPYKEDEKN